VWTLQTKALIFTRLDQFRDQHEAALSKPTYERVLAEDVQAMRSDLMTTLRGESLSDDLIRELAASVIADLQEETRQETFVNCWHVNASESLAMWELYGGKGIAIRSTVRDLLMATKREILVCKVAYVDHRSDVISDFWPFLFKRRIYAYEQEARAFFEEKRPKPRRASLHPARIPVSCTLDALIQEVRLAPGSRDWFYETVGTVLKTYGLPHVPVI
jgi:hypothetical protein